MPAPRFPSALALTLIVVASGGVHAQVSPPPVDRLLVCEKAASRLLILDPATKSTVAVVPTGVGPHEVAVAPDGRTAVVSDYGDRTPGSTLTVVDVERGAVLRTIVLLPPGEPDKRCLRPHGVVFASATKVLVTSEMARALLVVDVERGVVERLLSTPQGTAHMVARTADAHRAATTSVRDGDVALFDLTAKELAAPTIVAAGEGAEGLGIDPSRGAVWVANRTANTLTVVRDGKAAPPIATGALPFRVAFTHDAALALVTCADAGEVEVFDAAKGERIGTIPIAGDTSELSALPMGICVDPADRFAYLTCGRGEYVAVIDLHQRAMVDRIPAPGGPDGVAFARFTPRSDAAVRAEGRRDRDDR